MGVGLLELSSDISTIYRGPASGSSSFVSGSLGARLPDAVVFAASGVCTRLT